MKKKLLVLLPIFLLASCGARDAAVATVPFTPTLSEENGLPVLRLDPTSNFTTYLMCSRYGYVDVAGVPEKGKVDEKFFENTIVLKAEPGTALPEAKSEIAGVTFRGWAYYDPSNDHVVPDYYTTVPTVEGLALKAIFDGPEGGGGGGGDTPTPVTEAYQATIQVDLSIFSGWQGISNFSVYVWGDGQKEPLGGWNACAGNLTGDGNIKSVTTPSINYPIVGAVFYFDQADGQNDGRKQTTNMNIHISSTGTYKIQPTGTQIVWENGMMSNFTIAKVN